MPHISFEPGGLRKSGDNFPSASGIIESITLMAPIIIADFVRYGSEHSGNIQIESIMNLEHNENIHIDMLIAADVLSGSRYPKINAFKFISCNYRTLECRVVSDQGECRTGSNKLIIHNFCIFYIADKIYAIFETGKSVT